MADWLIPVVGTVVIVVSFVLERHIRKRWPRVPDICWCPECDEQFRHSAADHHRRTGHQAHEVVQDPRALAAGGRPRPR